MSGVLTLRRIQLGREAAATPGTPVLATSIFRGMGVLEDDRPVTAIEENVGYMAPTNRTYIGRLGAKLALVPVPATFEQVGYLFEMGILSIGTGVADGGGTGKIYNYIAPVTAKNVIAAYTAECGDDQQKAEAEFLHAQTITLAGKYGEAVMMSADLAARKVTRGIYSAGVDISFTNSDSKISMVGADLAKFVTGTTIKVSGSTSNDGIYTVATGGVAAEIVVTEALADESAAASIRIEDWYTGGPTGLSLVDVEPILVSTGSLAIDDVDGTVGATVVSNTMIDFSAVYNTGLRGQENVKILRTSKKPILRLKWKLRFCIMQALLMKSKIGKTS